MRHFHLLTVSAVTLLSVSACGYVTDGDMSYLGSRDDIVVQNNGMTKSQAKEMAAKKIETVKDDVAMATKGTVISGSEKIMSATKMGSSSMEAVPMRSSSSVSSASMSMPPGAAGDIPPNAKSGECYAKVLIPAVTETETRRIQVSEEQRVLDRMVPARYEVRTERVQVSEEKQVLDRIIPAKYSVETERVMVKEARKYWKAGSGPITKKNEVTGEIMCLVEEPAEFRTIEKRVMVEPEKPIYRMQPAEFKTIEKRVLVEPERPEYRTVPAQFETIRKTRVVQPERWEWRRILCETNMGTDSIQRIQRALRDKGYNVTVDGRLGDNTYDAINSYQRKNGLATRGITYETLERLGVRLTGA
jgi:hypothetical protein